MKLIYSGSRFNFRVNTNNINAMVSLKYLFQPNVGCYYLIHFILKKDKTPSLGGREGSEGEGALG